MRRMRVRWAAAMIAPFIAISGAAAQETPVKINQDDGIVVQGQREIPPAVARRYVGEITASVDGQLTRFSQPICPTVIGFADQYSGIVERRIRAVAREAGAEVAAENCSGNLVVIIAKDADALVKELRVKRPAIFEGVNDVDLKRAFRDGPVHAWNTVMLLNEDGQQMRGGTMTVKSASILNLPTQQAITGSMIVIDDDATLGKTLTQLADYVAMRALAGALPPRKDVPADTILTLFDGLAAGPPMLSAVDRSYLRGLYDTDPMMKKNSAMGRISRQIQEDAKERSGAN